MEKEKKMSQFQVRRWLQHKAARNRIPISGSFELTPRCNMNCRMCYIRMSEEEMSARGREYTAKEWIELGRVCRENGMLFLLLTGGEPFLRKDFREIYTELHKLGLSISINTNGTLIDEETVEWLRKMPPARINITLYGGNNETYAELCRNPKGYDQATHAIEMLSDAGIFVNINASLTPYNIGDMDAIYDFAANRGLRVNGTSYMFPPMRSAKEGKLDESVRFTPREAGAALYEIKKHEMNEDAFGAFLEHMRKGIVTEGIDDEECTRTPDERMGCMAGRSSFWVTWDGRMTPCGMMNFPVARPFEDGFQEAWKFITEETDKILLPPECRDCKKRFACMVCGALTIAEGKGDSTRKPEYLCGMTETYLRMCEAGKDGKYEGKKQ